MKEAYIITITRNIWENWMYFDYRYLLEQLGSLVISVSGIFAVTS